MTTGSKITATIVVDDGLVRVEWSSWPNWEIPLMPSLMFFTDFDNLFERSRVYFDIWLSNMHKKHKILERSVK